MPTPQLTASPTTTPPPPAVLDVSVWTGTGWTDHQDVLIEDGTVTGIRDHRPGSPGLDGSGAHLLPGFVNTHTHLQQATCRGVGEGQPLLAWLLSVGEHMASVTPESAYLATVAGALEGLRSGTTTLVEHLWPHPSREVHAALLRGLEDVGVRALVGRGIADRPDPSRRWGFDPRLMEPLEDVLAHVDELVAGTRGSRTTPALAVPNPRSLTPEGLRAVAGFAGERDLRISIHLLETETDDVMCREHTGRGAVQYLDEAGFLSDRVLAVHGVALSGEDIRVLADRGAALSHNPVSNMRLGSGVAPVPALLAAGVPVGLGVDGAASNDRQDMLETLRTTAYVQRATHRRADLLGFADVVAMAVDGAGGVLGLPRRPGGGVTVGTPADLTLVRFDRDFGCLPVREPGAALLTTGSPRIVDTVMVDGEVVVRDGRSTRIDEDRLVAALRA
ncbi:amidohydrolase family protein [Kineococcus aurantiacus]|uniref:5-methylthioadenosine/S-adenosylhomocysteine deaminase n=1 Tax=Kineococcus aurantiacus TaxID=37633 RepID=A0A7Y9ARC5_9ACTN|nr:5-methylthioadenosine/S-adenosylhomocysteine deaminase [Kineococcus aurantiacus]